jgi:hypothetical protein
MAGGARGRICPDVAGLQFEGMQLLAEGRWTADTSASSGIGSWKEERV